MAWSYSGSIGQLSTPVVANGEVYIGGEGVFAFNATTGALLWQYQDPQFTGAYSYNTPAVAGGIVYSGATDGYIYALNASTGALVWRQGPVVAGWNCCAPVVGNGLVFVGSNVQGGSYNGEVYALNASTGVQVWTYGTPGGVYAAPTLVGSVLYVNSDDEQNGNGGVGAVYAFDAASGTVLWSTGLGYGFDGSPVVVNGVIYDSMNRGYLFALDATTGAVKWAVQGCCVDGETVAVANGAVYGWGAENVGPDAIYALDASSGHVLWAYVYSDMSMAGVPGPTVANGVLYVGGGALAAADGFPLWVFTISGYVVYGAPAVSNGLVYIGATDLSYTNGTVYALGASPPPTDGPAGFERLGDDNPSELGYCKRCHGDPIDTASGNFSHTFADLSIPGRGLSLAFSHTYNSGTASIGGPLGYGWSGSYEWSLSFDGSGNATIEQENGSTVTFAPNGSGSYTPPARVLARLVKNGDGSYTFTRLQDQTHYTFSGSTHQLVAETDRNGYATTFTYNISNGQVSTVTDPSGRHLTFSYDTNGHLIGLADPGGRTLSFAYDSNGNLVAFTDVGGGVWHFSYDSNHLLLTMSDPLGHTTTNVYDSSGRVTSQTDPMNRTTSFSYAGHVTTTTDPGGNVTLEQYVDGLLVSTTRGEGTAQAATWQYTYDPVDLGLTSTIDPRGDAWLQTWDALGNILSKTDPLGRTTSYTYNSVNEVLTDTDALGVTTTYRYDANGNLLSVATPFAGTSRVRTTTYTYGDASHPGDVTAMIDPDGKTWAYTYDAYGDRITSTDPLGATTTDAYNVLGECTAVTTPLGHTSNSTYDAFGEVVITKNALGVTTVTNQYDADQNLIAQTDANGNLAQYGYDADNELVKTTRADGSVLSYGYDADGNQISQTDGLGHTTTYAYDSLNRLSSTTDPLGRTTSYGYDGAGNRTSLKNASGQTTTYGYDPANQLVVISYSDGKTPGVSYTYDADGQRISMSDGTGTTTYAYDSLHRLTASTNGAGTTMSYTYDLRGGVTSIVYPGSHSVTRSYDNAGRLASVTDWLGHTSTFTYTPDGNLLGITYANGLLADESYDVADRLSTIAYDFHPVGPQAPNYMTRVATFSYSRDAQGLLTATTNSTVGSAPFAGQDQSYQYTALSQLSGVSGYSATSYAYDHGDNLITLGTPSGMAALTYDSANELTKLVLGSTTTAYSYDARGDRTQAATGSATVSLSYDEENRLTGYAASATGTSATYTYNGDGLRMSKKVNGGAPEAFTWESGSSGEVPLLLQDGTTDFIYGANDMLLEQIPSGGTPLFAHQDQLGSTRLLTDIHGAVVATYTFDAYGRMLAHAGAASTSLQYAGQYTDAESGFVYLRARLYDPATGQFLSRDPVVQKTHEPYAYVAGDPLNGTDVTGLDCSWNPLDWGSCAQDAWNGADQYVANNAATLSSEASYVQDVAGTFTIGVTLFAPQLLPVVLPFVVGVELGAGLVKAWADSHNDPSQVNSDLIATSGALLSLGAGPYVEWVGSTCPYASQAAQVASQSLVTNDVWSWVRDHVLQQQQ